MQKRLDMKKNSTRFINAYNRIDACLRSIYNFKANISFTDLIRRCSEKNYVVRANETELVDYARLRNAIIHKSTGEIVIAEPHDSVVENFERIAKLLCTPPLAIHKFKDQKVISIDASESIAYAIKLIYESSFSNIPVYEDYTLKGVINNKIIVEKLGRVLLQGKSIDDYLVNTTVESILEESYFDKYFALCDKNTTMEKLVSMFAANRRLIAVLMTEKGTRLECPICIITAYDMLEITEILDNY